jgi:hypothetical protein
MELKALRMQLIAAPSSEAKITGVGPLNFEAEKTIGKARAQFGGTEIHSGRVDSPT